MLFIVPHYGAKDGFIWKAIEYRFHSPGVLSIAAYLRSHGFKVLVFDCNLEQISESRFVELFEKRFKAYSFRFFGFTGSTQTINQAYRLAAMLRNKFQETKIVFGGPHPSALPQDVLNNSVSDYVVIGEGEITSLELLQGKNLKDISGLAYRQNDKIVYTDRRERIADINDLPVAAYDLVPMHLCHPLTGTYKSLPATILVTARGCPGNCTFCSRTVGNKLCTMTPQRIIQEIEVLYYKYGFRQIIFYDDTFIADKTRISEFCDLLLASGMKINWTCSSRVDRVYPDLLLKMKNAGCHQIMYGVESFNDQVLKNINKHTTREHVFFAINQTRKTGIEARAAIMIGNKGDTEQILKDNITQLKKLNPDLLQVTITTPLPGSELFRNAMDQNKILTYDWDRYEGNTQIAEHETLSYATLKKYYRKTYLQFYLRPSYMWTLLFKTNSWLRLKVLLIGAFSILPIVFSSVFKKSK